jgi:hypothetical protein
MFSLQLAKPVTKRDSFRAAEQKEKEEKEKEKE